MSPETKDDPAWHHPLEYLAKQTDGRHAVFIESSMWSSRYEDLSNGERLEVALAGSLANQGFRHWLWAEPEVHVHSIHQWLKVLGNSRSLAAVVEGVQEYMDSQTGTLSLRETLEFPNSSEPPAVTRDVRYWQAVRECKERAGAEVRLYMTEFQDQCRAAMGWMRASKDKKFIVMGDGGIFQAYAYSDGCTTREASLVVHHEPAMSDYDWRPDQFRLYPAIRYAAYQVGRKKGWGAYQSAAFPVKDNTRFLQAFESGEFKDLSDEFLILFDVNTSDYADAAVFTAEDDDEGGHSSSEPLTVDTGAGLAGSRGR
jgi:hypothetical protein